MNVDNIVDNSITDQSSEDFISSIQGGIYKSDKKKKTTKQEAPTVSPTKLKLMRKATGSSTIITEKPKIDKQSKTCLIDKLKALFNK